MLNNIDTSSIYSRVDRLLEGTDEDKQEAFEELSSNSDKVFRCIFYCIEGIILDLYFNYIECIEVEIVDELV